MPKWPLSSRQRDALHLCVALILTSSTNWKSVLLKIHFLPPTFLPKAKKTSGPLPVIQPCFGILGVLKGCTRTVAWHIALALLHKPGLLWPRVPRNLLPPAASWNLKMIVEVRVSTDQCCALRRCDESFPRSSQLSVRPGKA